MTQPTFDKLTAIWRMKNAGYEGTEIMRDLKKLPEPESGQYYQDDVDRLIEWRFSHD